MFISYNFYLYNKIFTMRVYRASVRL